MINKLLTFFRIEKIFTIYNKKQRIMFAFLFIGILISAFLELMGISLVVPFINVVTNPSIIETNKYLNFFYIWLHIETQHGFLIFLALVLIGIYIFKNVYMLTIYFFQFKIFYDAQKEISLKLLTHCLNRPYAYHINLSSSEFLRTVTNDTLNCSHFMANLFFILSEFFVLVLIIAFLFLINKIMTISLICLFIVMFFGVFKKLKKIIERAGENNKIFSMRIMKWIQQSLGAIKEIKLLKKEEFFIDNYYAASIKYASANKRLSFLQNAPRLAIETSVVCSILTVIIVLLAMGMNAESVIVQMAVFAIAAFRLMPSINRLQIALTSMIFHRVSIDIVEKSLTQNSSENITEDENKEIDFTKDLSVKNITYRYPNTETDIFQNISFDIKNGQSVGFIGQTGTGKTTLIDVVIGLLLPVSGSVTMGGVDIHRNRNSLAKHIGYVPQFIFLTDDTIKNNITFYSDADNNKDENLLNSVIEQAQLKEFIASLPDGLDTVVGERGIRLSGGQRQRIGIARALYNKPKLLVLDEATSALDNKTEESVMKAIENLYGKMTLIVIAHRLTTIEKCDKVFEIKDKKLIVKK